MRPLVIYHADCADGFGAAFAAWLKLGDEAEYLALQYGESEKRWFSNTFCSDDVVSTLDGREVYILDFLLPRDHMEYLFMYAKRVVWLDHHKSAFETTYPDHDYLVHGVIDQDDPRKYVELNNWKSGAMFAWEFFHPGTEVPMLVKHIDDRDRWIFAIPRSRELNSALWSLA